MELVRGRGGGVRGPRVDAERVAPPVGRSYRRLTLADRAFVQAARGLRPPVSIRKIAGELGVAPSTISRELRAHRVKFHAGQWRYHAEAAHQVALRDRERVRPRRLDDPVLRDAVVARLNDKLSPQQVAAELKTQFPDRPEMHVSHETIYQALYVQGYGTLRHELTVAKALRSGRAGRKPQSKLPRRDSRPWLDGARISERPAEAADRAVPGHWEGDLVVGPNNSGIITLIERRSRYVMLGRLPGSHDSTTVIDVLQQMIERLPETLFASITWDQGTEMARHADFTIATGCPVFFADPHSPWQRPTNENVNGLIRDFYPKGTDFNHVTDADLTEAERLLNRRPRHILDWRKPREVLFENITGVALAA
ncbi:IS30 family transposase [Microbacterium gorillae]|uniref:IS30 family transposase n=1 Tax=Microbacterium gorillae TaxID=1231063 RepID=UPI000B9A6CEB|nr:IS30 family transposase [Microbacterium gorillae]